MTAKTIETKAIISAEDKTGPAFAAVIQHMARMEDAARRTQAHVKALGSADDIEERMRHKVRYEHHERVAQERASAKQARAEEIRHLREVERFEDRRMARRAAIGMAGVAVGHATAHFAHRSLETYREFDKERRFGRAVMGISDDDQRELVQQAIHMGGSTKYNDIQVLESQRELAARGLNKNQILGVMSAASDLGQSLDLTLPEAVKQMEGAIFGFKKNIDTVGDAMKSARQTADVQVKAAKISGMTPEDIQQIYKRDATPSRMSGVSEQFMLAFGAISKKAMIGGDEASTAYRALISAANAPTRGAKEALLANGMDYSKYQKKIDHIDVDPFVRNVAAQYGVALNKKAVGSLSKIFSDPKVLNDPALFTPAVTKALGGALGKKDAKSLKSIAGMANRFRTATGGGADVDAFLLDLMVKMGSGKGGIALANAIFGAKQGGRIANALGDPETLKKMRDQLDNHSEGYAQKISQERMAGFDGAVSRFEGAVKNLESALPRAFDADGKGGMLTGAADVAGRFVQALAEAPPQLQRLGTEAGLVAGAFAGIKGLEALMGGFGLKGAAIELTAAAHALMGASGAHTLEDLAPGGGKKKSGGGLGKFARSLPVIGSIVIGTEEGVRALNEDHDAEFGPGTRTKPYIRRGPQMGGNEHAASLKPKALSPFGGLDGARAAMQQVSVSVTPPPPLKVQVEVTAGSELIAIKNAVKALEAKLALRADTGPGGLGETHTGQ